MIAILVLLISIAFSQSILHSPIDSSPSNQSINFSIFVDSNNREIDKASLMYKNINQTEYLSNEMNSIGNNNFQCIITDHFSNKLDINYFFIVEFKDGGMISHPIDNSYLIDINNYQDDYWEDMKSDKKIDLLVLSPLPGSIVEDDNIMIAASMFSVNYVDIDNVNILIDEEDITAKALITDNFLSIPKLDLSPGNHKISINITNKFGIKYAPYNWSFTVKNKEKKSIFNKNINQSLRYWSSYLHSNINENDIEHHNHNLIYNIDLNWLKIRSNFKISSLENIYEQSKNRYSITLANETTKLDIGDFHPYFNNYILNGSRVRGFNFNTRIPLIPKYLFASVNFIKGELQRAIQGDPFDNSVYISEVDTSNNILTINRDNYAFKREMIALKLGVDFRKKILWNINLFKAKDNINSVYATISNPQLEISEEYIDTQYADNDNYLDLINDSTYVISYDDFNQGFIYNVDSINYLNDHWSGDKPKDNLIIGSELLFNLDEGKTVIHAEINLSMLNENLWNSITEISQLDTLGTDTIQDGLFMGNSLEEAEMILKYNDFFELGFDQVPYFPYDQDANILDALLNMPSVIYEFDSKFNYGNHSVKYLYEKIGPQFNSLGNLYTQTNTLKRSLSDRMRFFDNRLYVYIDYTKQKEGLDLIDDNMTKTNTGTFNLSLYPGANLPNINIGFSNRDRSNNAEVYSEEDCQDSCIVLDDREHVYTNNYNFSINDKVLFIKEHNINFSMFISNKKDMLFEKKILLNDDYYSPRSYNQNLSLSILTTLSQNWSSNITYNSSNFNSGNDNVDSYYQEQNITSMDLFLKYSGPSLLERLKFGFSNINGQGYQDFIYYNFKLSASHRLFNSLRILWNYDYQMKWIANDDVMYNDSIFKMKLVFSL